MADKLMVMVFIAGEDGATRFRSFQQMKERAMDFDITESAAIIDLAAYEKDGIGLFDLKNLIQNTVANHTIRRHNINEMREAHPPDPS